MSPDTLIFPLCGITLRDVRESARSCPNKRAAARRLGISERQFYSVIAKMGLGHLFTLKKPGRRAKQKAIEEEFGETFSEVVQGFASQGESLRGTAEALGMSKKHLRRLCRQLGIRFKPRMELKPECRGVGHPSHAARNRARAGSAVTISGGSS